MAYKRPSWDEYFMKVAMLVSERSTCVRQRVGAVIVKDKRIITTGYNGASKGLKDCLELGCLRDELKIPSGKDKHICRSVHAEQNALIQAAFHGISTNGGILYCTHDVCPNCARIIINAGIKKVVVYVKRERHDSEFKNLFDEAGIEFIRVEKPDNEIKTMEYREV